jgi:hypothetical protein
MRMQDAGGNAEGEEEFQGIFLRGERVLRNPAGDPPSTTRSQARGLSGLCVSGLVTWSMLRPGPPPAGPCLTESALAFPISAAPGSLSRHLCLSPPLSDTPTPDPRNLLSPPPGSASSLSPPHTVPLPLPP